MSTEADEERVEDGDGNDDGAANKGKKSAKHDSGAADLEKVTDYVEEAEISSQNIGEVVNSFISCSQDGSRCIVDKSDDIVCPQGKKKKRNMSTEADEERVEDGDGNDDGAANKGKKSAKHDSGAADLEKVTDYVEEAEISSQNIGEAIRVASDQKHKQAVARQEKEKELSKVKISKEDVDLIVREMEISRAAAERKLREHKGNLVEALVVLTN